MSFAVWAPNARSVRIVGDFDRWDGRLMPMRSMGASGVWELFVPGIGAGELYKFEILGQDGKLRLKADPLAFAMQVRPETASRVWDHDLIHVDRRRLDGRARDAQPVSVADGRLRGPPRLLDAQPRRLVARLPPGGRGARRALPGVRLHPRRAAAGGRAPVRRLVGLPGHRLLRADLALRQPRRLRRDGRHAAQRRDRGHRGLGAGPLPDRRLRPAPLRRHAALRARRPAAWRASRLGHAHLRLRPPRGPQLPRRQRPVLDATATTSMGCGSTPWPRCSTSTTRARPGSGRRTSTAGARTSRRSPSCAR